MLHGMQIGQTFDQPLTMYPLVTPPATVRINIRQDRLDLRISSRPGGRAFRENRIAAMER